MYYNTGDANNNKDTDNLRNSVEYLVQQAEHSCVNCPHSGCLNTVVEEEHIYEEAPPLLKNPCFKSPFKPPIPSYPPPKSREFDPSKKLNGDKKTLSTSGKRLRVPIKTFFGKRKSL